MISAGLASTAAVAPLASCFSSSRRLATAAAATSATASGCVRSATAASCSTRSCLRSSSMPSGPVTASIRRTLAALEVSCVILKTPISAVERTCVPPHSSRDQSPAPTSTIRTTSPYFSPNSAIAPSVLGLVERRRQRAHGLVLEHHLVHAVLDPLRGPRRSAARRA